MLHYNTVNELLKNSLTILMQADVFKNFRLVGGTALSLQIGHRESIDIDLFSDAEYGTINFEEIEAFLKANFNYVDSLNVPPAIGKAYFIGEDKDNTVKLDIFYTDSFIQPYLEIEGIRVATIEEIIAMKLDVIQRVGRKKDFWDLHDLLDSYTITQMIELHNQRYPYTHDRNIILQNFTNFEQAEDDLTPICYRGKYWEFIKEDFEEIIASITKNK
ncbi:nucleotidyl transferase AbiEii/AbiGii toxin family protein [Flavobacterium capsici]|uniref:Nucleotidyl transferase AbiEii/AbiGii toxin family protein n=1 Tax=Flavobacterium capsici TaxID=3075618 RepID=A0AA96EY95_9FLAO|nr:MULTISPECIES: nucleotidyl transferase AbiEii/AbiGii toxin family protein [unclassified Flavobacterium]WNM19493.1 nucleotidyl transferase AbiEii/AbiGii toxin family protein [Flavobacterium sp. PMR2A8]WNM20882.1 nucleotidyl transferase AbiEii/AbiGii toxin family protein [Flavobacterium sp. PMTSA4]